MIASRDIDISSAYNQSYKEFLTLLTGRGVKKSGRAIVSGSKVVPEVIRQKPEIISAWIASAKHGQHPLDLPDNIARYRLSSQLFRTLDINGTGRPLLIVNVPVMETFNDSVLFSGGALFVPFQDPANVGAVIRSAAAFDISTIVLLEESANPFHHKSIRAAGTSLFNTRLLKGPSINNIEDFRWPLIALDAGGVSLHEFVFPEKFILLPGLEGSGLPKDAEPDHVLSIPMNEGVESLNAAVAVSIALYEWQCQRNGSDISCIT